MEEIKKDNNLYKVRVYLISAQNLTAQGSVIDLKSKLAGMTALCTANPYPKIVIGNQDKSIKNTILTKSINDREKGAKMAELSPQFNSYFELDCQLPEDWKMEISIMNKAQFVAADSLIGATTIDLENRRYGDPLMQAN